MSDNKDTFISSADDKTLRSLDDAETDNDDDKRKRKYYRTSTSSTHGSDAVNLRDKVGHHNSNELNISSDSESADRYQDESKPSKGHSSRSRHDRHHSRNKSDGKHRDKKKPSKKRHRNKDDKYYSEDNDDSESSSDSDEYSSHSDSDDDRRRRRHDKEKKKKHESKKHKKRDDRSRDRKSKRHKHKKDRRRDDSATTETFAAASPTFGQYGIIKASDMTKMQRSFEIWLSEVHGVHISSSSIPRYELQQYFDTYREDYNTATLPHIKYYNYDKWELEEHEKQKRELEQSGQNSSALINDERNHAMEMQRIAKQKEEAALQLVAATMNTTKVKEMQHQKQLQSQMQMAFKMGDHETYRKIKEKLQPPEK
jgi:hypothetical protein